VVLDSSSRERLAAGKINDDDGDGRLLPIDDDDDDTS